MKKKLNKSDLTTPNTTATTTPTTRQNMDLDSLTPNNLDQKNIDLRVYLDEVQESVRMNKSSFSKIGSICKEISKNISSLSKNISQLANSFESLQKNQKIIEKNSRYMKEHSNKLSKLYGFFRISSQIWSGEISKVSEVLRTHFGYFTEGESKNLKELKQVSTIKLQRQPILTYSILS